MSFLNKIPIWNFQKWPHCLSLSPGMIWPMGLLLRLINLSPSNPLPLTSAPKLPLNQIWHSSKPFDFFLLFFFIPFIFARLAQDLGGDTSNDRTRTIPSIHVEVNMGEGKPQHPLLASWWKRCPNYMLGVGILFLQSNISQPKFSWQENSFTCMPLRCGGVLLLPRLVLHLVLGHYMDFAFNFVFLWFCLWCKRLIYQHFG